MSSPQSTPQSSSQSSSQSSPQSSTRHSKRIPFAVNNEDGNNATVQNASAPHTVPSAGAHPDTIPPERPASSLLFGPTLFQVDSVCRPGQPVLIRPEELVNSIPRTSMTVDHLIWDLFVEFLIEDAGFIPEKHYLMGYVPDECGQNVKPRFIPSGGHWRAMLQRCHNVGDKACKFLVLDGKVEKHREPDKVATHKINHRQSLLYAVPSVVLVLGALVYLSG